MMCIHSVYSNSSVSSVMLTDYEKWDEKELYEYALKNPELKDSVPEADQFKAAYEADKSYDDLLKVYLEMTERGYKEAEPDNAKYAEWEQKIENVMPTEIQESNMKLLTEAERVYAKAENESMPEELLGEVTNLAKKCMVTDGEAVLLARSLYYRVTNDFETDFADECINKTGFYKDGGEDEYGVYKSKGKLKFVIYPNPTDLQTRLTLETNEAGIISIYNPMGQLIQQIEIHEGFNALLENNKLISKGIYNYKFVSKNGESKTGKLIIQ